MKSSSLFQLYCQLRTEIVNALPGQHKQRINFSNELPLHWIQELERIKHCDCVFLEICDHWEYSEHPLLIDYFQSRPQQSFYILHIGYQNKKICHNAFELATNLFLPRLLTKFETKTNPEKSYGCLNRVAQFHRTLLGFKLWQRNLLSNVIYTLQSSDTGADFLLNKMQNEPGWDEFQKLIPFKYLDHDGADNDHSTAHPAYATFCNIVTESRTEVFRYDAATPAPTITEKSYKPFLSCQIPIFLASQGHLAYLKKFGFDVFEDILPAGYDDMDTFAKVDTIVDLVRSCPIKDIYFDSINRIRHNHQLVTSDKVQKQVVDEVVNFVYNN